MICLFLQSEQASFRSRYLSTESETTVGNFPAKFFHNISLVLFHCGMQARIWDMRMLDSDSCLAELPHSRVVTSAYFSPVTGTKILTTCQDNRIRVWDNICADLTTCSREIVHSHDFNRYLTSFKAEWDPKV